MYFSEIAVGTTSQAAELIAYFVQEVCLDGVCIYDRNDLYNNASWDYKDDSAEAVYGEEVVVKGYCNSEDTERVLHFLREKFASLTDAGSLHIEVRQVDGDAWVDKWRETFRPLETSKLVICPEWLTVDTDKKVFLFDSGVAFGTGRHETTSMCLEIAEQLDLRGKRVLDVGCGSGILGLCSLLLGADSAVLTDIDSQATEVARHNAAVNDLSDRCSVRTGNLTEQADGTFDVVFANLTADILLQLRQSIADVLHSGSLVVLSGILDVRLEQVQAAFDAFTVLSVVRKGEWCALLLRAE